MRERLLVVEDEQANREILERVLRRAGFEIVLACDGEEAKRLLQKENFAVVVTDWNMPQMSGEQLARWIRKSPRLGRLPILMLTVRSEAEVQGFACGVDDFLPKPFTPKELIARVEKLLSLKGT